MQSEIAGDRTPRSHHGSATHRFVLRVQVYHSDHLQLDPSSQRTLPCLASSRTYLKKYSVLVVLLVFGIYSLLPVLTDILPKLRNSNLIDVFSLHPITHFASSLQFDWSVGFQYGVW